MKETNELEIMGRIGMVDPPPFLLTRIEARIAAVRAEKMPVSWAVGLALTLLLMITMNVSVYQHQLGTGSHAGNNLRQLAKDLALSATEQLYQ